MSIPRLRSGEPRPSTWVAHFLDGVPADERVLDVACGAGRHVRLAVGRGFAVTAVDRDVGRLADLAPHPDIEIVEADLEDGSPFPLAARTYGGVIVTNYLWRPILPAIAATVAAHGILIYETFAEGHERLGGRPSNPDFLLRPNELLQVATAAGLIVVAFEQVREDDPRSQVVQRIAAVGQRHPWVTAPPPRR